MKFKVTLFAPTSVNSDEFEVEADSLEAATAMAIAMGQDDKSDVVWNTEDVDANINSHMIDVADIYEVEEEKSA